MIKDLGVSERSVGADIITIKIVDRSPRASHIGDALLKLVDRHGGIRLQFNHIFERMIVDPNIFSRIGSK